MRLCELLAAGTASPGSKPLPSAAATPQLSSPAASNARTTSTCPLQAACASGDRPALPAVSGHPPAASSAFTTPALPLRAANARGVSPVSSFQEAAPPPPSRSSCCTPARSPTVIARQSARPSSAASQPTSQRWGAATIGEGSSGQPAVRHGKPCHASSRSAKRSVSAIYPSFILSWTGYPSKEDDCRCSACSERRTILET